ncbi:MAG: response regulator [Flavobacteriaceae bacterium]
MQPGLNSSIKILLVSGNPFLRGLMRGMLRDAGATGIEDIATLREFTSRLNTAHFDLVIGDFEFEDGTGVDLLRSIRGHADAGTAKMPVILLCSTVSRRMLMQAVREGVNDLLVKPFSQRTLVAHVTTALRDERPFVRRQKYVGPLPRPALLNYLQQNLGQAAKSGQKARLMELIAKPDEDEPVLV